jgi:hypothetical protein
MNPMTGYRFLCVRDNWPRNRAAEERDELAPLCMTGKEHFES